MATKKTGGRRAPTKAQRAATSQKRSSSQMASHTRKATGSTIGAPGGVRNQRGPFLYKGKPQSPRRKGPPPPPRKMYAYTRKDQAGHAAEAFIERNRVALDTQYNAATQSGKLNVGDRMSNSDATGSLRQNWKRIVGRHQSPQRVKDYVRRTGLSKKAARAGYENRWSISFGCDPKSK